MKQKGFTLIELLVVIAIIGLLASIVLVSLNSARAKSRDVKRHADFRQLATALELYYGDNSNQYPNNGNRWTGVCPSNYNNSCGPAYNQACTTSGSTGWIPNLAPTYLSQLPVDPNPRGTDQCYLYNSNGTDYKVLDNGNMESTITSSDSMYDSVHGTTSISIHSAGGAGF